MQSYLASKPPFDSVGTLYGPQQAPSRASSTLPGASTTLAAAVSTNTSTAGMDPAQSQTVLPVLDGTILGTPVGALIAVIGICTLLAWALHKYPGIQREVATPRFGLGSFWSIGVQAILFIVVAKTVLTRYRIPGLSELVGSV